MTNDIRALPDGPGSRPSDRASEAVSTVPASIPNADEIAEAAASCLDPARFEPLVRRIADEAYDRLLEGVQDYLIDNARFNIASRISAAENRAHNQALRIVTLEARLSLLIRAIDRGDPNWAHALTRARAELPSLDNASGIEARRAATPQSGAVHESPVGEAEAPEHSRENPNG